MNEDWYLSFTNYFLATGFSLSTLFLCDTFFMLITIVPFCRSASKLMREYFIVCVLISRCSAAMSLWHHHLTRFRSIKYYSNHRNEFCSVSIISERSKCSVFHPQKRFVSERSKCPGFFLFVLTKGFWVRVRNLLFSFNLMFLFNPYKRVLSKKKKM